MAKKVLITGSGGLVGSESVHFFARRGYDVVGIDNDMRAYYFGKEGSTRSNIEALVKVYKNYKHHDVDIRDEVNVEDIFKENKFDLIIHAAAQPSHDWAAREPKTDFSVNATGTLVLLENFRRYSPDGVFIFTSTNKVYGDTPNRLPLIEKETRYEIDPNHKYKDGIAEDMPVDYSTHSLFGVSKSAADLMVQEYGRYFNLMTGVFRGGCLTGSAHAGTQQHGFLSYLVKSILTGRTYTIFGYKGKQVRDNIHAHDLINAFYHFYQNPRRGEVYNIGGGRFANVSILEAIKKIEGMTGKKANTEYSEKNRIGDHIWYISSMEKFKKHYPRWRYEYDIDATLEDIIKNSAFSAKVDTFTRTLDYWKEKNWYFHNSLAQIFKQIVPEGASVLQVGYGLGDILAALFPKKGVSVDTDPNVMETARRRYPYLRFINMAPEELSLNEAFDYVILPTSVDHFYDVQTVLERIRQVVHDNSEIVMTSANPLWDPIFLILEKLNLKRPEPRRNRLDIESLKNIAGLAGYEVMDSGYRILIPAHVPFVSRWLNKIAPKISPLAKLCVTQYLVIKRKPLLKPKKLSCSIIIPCYNEEENIEQTIKAVPKMGKKTEIIVVDDGSTDNTSKVAESIARKKKNVRVVKYSPNRGKGYAVKRGFDAATGDTIMIFDADRAVPGEELPRFYNLLASGRAEFVNGTRLIYPMEEEAMKNLNRIGNLVFSWVFSWLLKQRITDTLCGTKALLKKDYKKIKMSGRSWGDFDLLFGAAENKLKIVEMPVHYKRRVAGESKMRAFKHGLVMTAMCLEGFWRLRAKPFLKSRS